MKIRSALFISALSALSTATVSVNALAADSGWYVLGSVGQAKYDTESKSSIDSDLQASVAPLDLASSSLDDSDSGYKLQVGYQFNQNFAVEGGYIDLGELVYKARVTDGFDSVGARLKTEAHGFNVSAVGILPLGSFSLFAKVGVIDAKVESKGSVEGVGNVASEDSTDVKPLFGLGAGYSFGDHLGVRVEWERFSNLGDDDSTGEGDVDLVSAGLIFKF
jgi:OOP family OmpA-OmpF porin